MPDELCVHGDCKKGKEIYNFCEDHFVNYFVSKGKQKNYFGDKERPSASYVIEEIRRRDSSLIKSESFFEEFQLWGRKGVSIRRVNKILKDLGHYKIRHPDTHHVVGGPGKEISCSICMAKGLQNCLCTNFAQFEGREFNPNYDEEA